MHRTSETADELQKVSLKHETCHVRAVIYSCVAYLRNFCFVYIHNVVLKCLEELFKRLAKTIKNRSAMINS